MRYHFQVDTAQTMDSQGGAPLFSFDQTAAQSFSGAGMFSGQDATVVAAGDAYNGTSTPTFVFYSSAAVLSPDAPYYWRARAQPSGGVYGAWTSTASFTTGRFAKQNPANHLAITGVNLFNPSTGGSVSVGFTIAENNVTTGTSAGGGAYNTADWIFVKFSTQAGADGTWNHATLTGGSVGAGATLALAADNKGVFLNHALSSAYWVAGATVTWNYVADGVVFSSVRVKVFAVSMVRVPQGSFVYNAGGIGGDLYNNYGAGSQVTVSNASQLPSGAPAGWPNAYASFYIGRYEVTQGQYAEFLNTIPSGSAAALYEPTAAYGHNITNAGVYPNKYAAVDPNAAKSYLSISDAWSYLNWTGLRPPTEMEFEKAGRDINGDTRTYPWGNTAPDLVTYTPPNEGGTCIKKFLNYNNTAGCTKVLDVGRYMSGDVYRTPAETGASPWGIADLAGNVWEFNINCSWASVPLNGDGTLNLPGSWPVPGASTVGLRGGSWIIPEAYVRVSARYNASWASTNRSNNVGCRGARTP
ncbi:MAG: SUMF1/EgtB/PvdO family nonheme iron enzyme [Elusimicrobiales bacterium]|nr:SUMF1/EgtB/PvdO family nonheme iron enzyme [Elusimicrobiales bacterium]